MTYKGLDDSHPQPNSDLDQLAEHGTDELKVVSSNPTGGNFYRNLFCFVSDRSIVKNSND